MYSTNCMDCTVSYIGVTTRVKALITIPTRMQEHCDAFIGVRYSTVADQAI